MALGKAWSKKHELKFLECSVDVVSLMELIYAHLSRGILNNDLKLFVTHSQMDTQGISSQTCP